MGKQSNVLFNRLKKAALDPKRYRSDRIYIKYGWGIRAYIDLAEPNSVQHTSFYKGSRLQTGTFYKGTTLKVFSTRKEQTAWATEKLEEAKYIIMSQLFIFSIELENAYDNCDGYNKFRKNKPYK